jgi:hypothetical protein
MIDAVRLGKAGRRELVSMRCGAIRFFWNKSLKEFQATFHARCEMGGGKKLIAWRLIGVYTEYAVTANLIQFPIRGFENDLQSFHTCRLHVPESRFFNDCKRSICRGRMRRRDDRL